jgi:hypothetical protein
MHVVREKITDCTYMRFYILTKINIKFTILWDMMPCLACRYHPFRRTCSPNLHDAMKMEVVLSSKYYCLPTTLHGITSQNTVIFE